MRPDKNPVFEKSHMTDEEVVLMARVIKKNNPELSTAEISLEIDLINDLLMIQESRTILNTAFITTAKGIRRKGVKRFMEVLDGRIGLHLAEVQQLKQTTTDKPSLHYEHRPHHHHR